MPLNKIIKFKIYHTEQYQTQIQDISHRIIPSSSLFLEKISSFNGLVKIYANRF